MKMFFALFMKADQAKNLEPLLLLQGDRMYFNYLEDQSQERNCLLLSNMEIFDLSVSFNCV